jgi:formylglycine-generating enzyme required for sulfatase activity
MTNMIDTQSMLRVGTILRGTYRIERYLSSGGFGNTYVAVHTEFGKSYAVKEFFMKGVSQRDGDSISVSVSNAANQSQFAEQKEKFKKEARRLFNLDNLHVVKVHDLFEDNGTVYYVMDFIDGESLSERLKRLGAPLGEAEVSQYLPQILDALACVHCQQIWHLDLKPANIMVDKSGAIKLIDFGASKQIRPDGGATTSTALCYTPGYAPNEQTEQSMEKFGPWTDFYALGATLYKLLTNNEPPKPSDIIDYGEDAFHFTKDVSTDIRSLILWMMNPNRKQRPQNVEDIQNKISGDDEKTISAEGHRNRADNLAKGNDAKDIVVIDGNTINGGYNSPAGVKTKKHKRKRVFVYVITIVIFIIFGLAGWKIFFLNVSYDTSTNTIKAKGVNYKMIKVDGGTFTMGATSEQGSDASDDEKPAHSVTLSSYYIGQTEVTQALWKAVMGSNPSYFEGDNNPVVGVSWYDCKKFISKLNKLTGKTFRLPTEAQWEFAARGGNFSRGYKYSGSNNIGDVAWYGNTGNATHDVGTKSPNELGLYDMSGNVWEWCSDCYGDYNSKSQTNPIGPDSGSYRVYRGGSWNFNAGCCRASDRSGTEPGLRFNFLGLRLVL